MARTPVAAQCGNSSAPPTAAAAASALASTFGAARLRAAPAAPLQRDLQHLVDPAHRHDLEVVLDVLRDVLQILDVLFRDQHGLDAATVRRQQLFLQAADRQ